MTQWQTKYPQSDFAQDRLQYFVATLGQLAPNDPSERKQLIEKANELLKTDPKNFTASYYIALWGPAVGGTSPSPELLSNTETAAHGVLDGADAAFPASKKPANMSEADWTKAKNQVLAVAHNALASVATSKKDNATAESEYKQSLTVNPDQGNVSYLYGKQLMDEKKYQDALFQFARAAQYDGPSAVPASARPQLLTYFNKVYGQFHGNPDGADKVLAAAKERFGVAMPFGGPTSSGMITLHCPPGQVHALASFLREQGADSVTVADIDYVFTRDNPLFAKLEQGLG